MKRFLLIIAILAYVPLAYGFGTAGEGCGNDCGSCHTVTKEEATTILRHLEPQAEVESVSPAPVRGLYQLVAKKGKDIGIVYLDFSKKFLITGRVIDTQQKKDVTFEEIESRRHIDPAAIPLENALVLGNSKGSRKLYVFTDPECPYCAKLHKELEELVKEDGELLVYILLFPLDMHPNALWKTDTIICASKKSMKKGLALLGDSFGGKQLKLADCGKGYGMAAKKLAADLGVSMTPTMVLPNGKVISGMKQKEDIRKLLDEALKKSEAAGEINRAK